MRPRSHRISVKALTPAWWRLYPRHAQGAYSLGSCCCRWVDQLLAAAIRQSEGGPLQTPNTDGHLLALSPLGKTLLADRPC